MPHLAELLGIDIDPGTNYQPGTALVCTAFPAYAQGILWYMRYFDLDTLRDQGAVPTSLQWEYGSLPTIQGNLGPAPLAYAALKLNEVFLTAAPHSIHIDFTTDSVRLS